MLASEYYDSDENGAHSPPLQARIVKSRPSPDPYTLPASLSAPSPESETTYSESRSKNGRIRRRPQPSQGDAVLIDILGNGNRPDLAVQAGEVPLDPEYHSDEEMEGRAEDQDFVQIAQYALPDDVKDESPTTTENLTETFSQTKVRPKIKTVDLSAKRVIRTVDNDLPVRVEGHHLNNHVKCIKQDSVHVGKVDSNAKDGAQASSNLYPNHQPRADSDADGKASAMPPILRQYTIPVSEGSPMETLPAMQSSPTQPMKSPIGQQSLPSLHAQLGSLADAPAIPDTNVRSNGLVHQGRQSFVSSSGSLNSPSKDLSLSRGTQYPTIQNRVNGHFAPSYPASHPSPATTISEASPRETYSKSQEPTSMSPPSRYPPHYNDAMTPQSDQAQTPISADSYASTGTLGSDISLNGDRMNIEEGRPILPPLSASGPLTGTGFKCEYVGCTAPPFQTQYLLK